jgi:hypothetical protein
LHLARAVPRGADHAEGGESELEARIAEPNVVPHIEELGPDLQGETVFMPK